MTRFRGALLFIGALFVYQVLYPSINAAVTSLGWLVEGRTEPWAEYYTAAARFESPLGIWSAHLALAALVLAAWAVYRFHHRRRLAWLWSVMPGVRWRYALACVLVAIVVFGAVTWYVARTGPGWDLPAGWGWYIVAIVVTSPIQALGEEVLFRGYITQALGLIWRQTWFPIIVSAALFAFFHGTQNVWLFLSRFAFGVVAGLLVWQTGGLEAGVAAHAINNIAAFSLALCTGQLVEARTLTTASWTDGVRDVLLFTAFAAAAWFVARRMRVPNRVE
jgi:membrane protease YdiL (CAAX protease family)